jgi:hypothetical protein
MTDHEVNKRLCELLNLDWHDCEHCESVDCIEEEVDCDTPDFCAHPVELLRVMEEKKVLQLFLDHWSKMMSSKCYNNSIYNFMSFLLIDGTLARTVLPYLEERRRG